MGRLAEAAERIRVWKKDPVQMVRELFQVEPDNWQAEGLRRFPEDQKQALVACKGPGKSAYLSWVGWNFLLTRLHPKVAATSITGDNLRDGLWTEMAKWQQRSPLLQEMFEWSETRIFSKQYPETWWMSARKWSRDADQKKQGETLAGLHADYILFLLDEAGSIPNAVSVTAEAALATGIECKVVCAGNPTDLDGTLYRVSVREKATWWVKNITGDPEVADRSPRVDKAWAQQQIDTWGRHDPFVRINVLGLFPQEATTALLAVKDVLEAMGRVIQPAIWEKSEKVLGVDVARQGDDRAVILARQGRTAFLPRIYRGLDLMSLSNEVANYINTWEPDATFIDGTGIGAGVVDRLRQLGYPVIEVIFGQASQSTNPRCVNRRAEMWWRMAEWVKNGGALPNMSELVQELTGPRFWFTQNDKLQLESKDDLRARGHASPDIADALALTFASPVAPRDIIDQMRSASLETWEYDPLDERRF